MATIRLAPQSGPCIVWADHPDFVLAVKPAGMSFHAEDGDPGFVASLKAQAGNADLHVVHRLDRITSGLLLCARNAEVAARCGQMFETGQISKFYLALSDRKPSKKQGWIKGAMEKARGGSWRLAREGDLRAVTQFFSQSVGEGMRLFVLRPRTGRTHQLRVAMKSLGAPILGDARYGGSPADRGYLHAYALCFDWQGDHWQFVLPPAQGECFQAVHDSLPGEPWLLEWPV